MIKFDYRFQYDFQEYIDVYGSVTKHFNRILYDPLKCVGISFRCTDCFREIIFAEVLYSENAFYIELKYFKPSVVDIITSEYGDTKQVDMNFAVIDISPHSKRDLSFLITNDRYKPNNFLISRDDIEELQCLDCKRTLGTVCRESVTIRLKYSSVFIERYNYKSIPETDDWNYEKKYKLGYEKV